MTSVDMTIIDISSSGATEMPWWYGDTDEIVVSVLIYDHSMHYAGQGLTWKGLSPPLEIIIGTETEHMLCTCQSLMHVEITPCPRTTWGDYNGCGRFISAVYLYNIITMGDGGE
jgi:hypothetical protein